MTRAFQVGFSLVTVQVKMWGISLICRLNGPLARSIDAKGHGAGVSVNRQTGGPMPLGFGDYCMGTGQRRQARYRCRTHSRRFLELRQEWHRDAAPLGLTS